MKRTQFYLTDAQRESLRKLARARSTTVSALIREAIAAYLEAQRNLSSQPTAAIARLTASIEKATSAASVE
ncbi:MAG TPA: CopG family transcriptional regulator [Galbitalea sp.]|jgi:predicted DNA-binding protein|nr:CopG family transcriptional regulator [Galbitalea sp.]